MTAGFSLRTQSSPPDSGISHRIHTSSPYGISTCRKPQVVWSVKTGVGSFSSLSATSGSQLPSSTTPPDRTCGLRTLPPLLAPPNRYCVLQLDHLLYGYWSPGTETAMFLRLDKSNSDQSNFTGLTTLLETTCPVTIALLFRSEESNATKRNIAIIATLFAPELLSGIAFFWTFLKKYIKYRNMAQTLGLELLPTGGPKRFTFAEIKNDTIGKGGFGDVYKGELPDKRVVAVKCLKNVAGGDAEFWAEVTIIVRMYHLNLVRLRGFCAEKGQRILIYKYVQTGP